MVEVEGVGKVGFRAVGAGLSVMGGGRLGYTLIGPESRC